MKPFTDEEIIGAIQSGGQASEEALRHLYLSGGLRREAVMAARRFGGNEADVEDLFQEGLWRVYEKIRSGQFEERSSIQTFFNGIVQNISLNEFTRRKRRSEILAGLSIEIQAAPVEIEGVSWKEKMAILEKPLAVLGELCRQVLEHWAAGYSIQEITELLGFDNEMAAKNKKKNCLHTLRVWMKNHPENAKWFKEG